VKHLHIQEANDTAIFFLNQMGNNLDAYRAAIGLFHACKLNEKNRKNKMGTLHNIIIKSI
jgi:hypothetical protein